MDPRDGHRECPSCLGMAHLREDVDNPCSAACDLPRGERLHRANRVRSSVPERGRERERSSDRHSRKRSRKHSRDGHEPHRSSHEKVVEVAKPPTPAPPAEDGNTDTHLQILAAIQSLAQRMDRVEARHSFSPSLPHSQEGVPPAARQGNPDTDIEEADVLSLIAPHSLVDVAQQAEEGSQGEEPHSDSAEVDGESTGRDDFPANTLVARVLSAAKILCLQPSVPDPAPVGGVWEGIPQTNSPSCIPVADDYTSMLRTTWKKPSQKPQFNAGCRRLANARYPKETGLGDMPPVEQEIASWTTLGPAYASANPRCPKKECAKTDRLISRSFNASARAARTGNALAILLAALRKTVSAEDQDSKNLVDSALAAHSQLTRDVGDAMSSAVLCRRQIWLAQTSLPETIRSELMNLPVVPGHVFNSNSQEVLDKAERSIATREAVQRACHKPAPVFRPRARETQRPQQPAWSRHGSGSLASGSQGQSFRPQRQNSAPYPQRRFQSRGGAQQRGSRKVPGRDGGPA